MPDFEVSADLTATVHVERIDPAPIPPTPTGETVYQASFSELTPGPFTAAMAQATFGRDAAPFSFPNDKWWADQGVTVVDDGAGASVLQVLLRANSYGTGPVLCIPLKQALEESLFTMDLRFAEGFDFALGGKLPGVGATNNSSNPPAGGGEPTNGYSARHMWNKQGSAYGASSVYAYSPGKAGQYGTNEWLGQAYQVGKWHTQAQRLKVNQVGQSDGIIQGALDSESWQLNRTDYLWRNAVDWLTNRLMFTVFRGGGDASWNSPRDGAIQFRSFTIAKPA